MAPCFPLVLLGCIARRRPAAEIPQKRWGDSRRIFEAFTPDDFSQSVEGEYFHVYYQTLPLKLIVT